MSNVNLLFLCTKNMVRSPMAEAVCRELAAAANHEQIVVRSAGTSTTAVRRLTTRDVAWAEVIVAMEPEHKAHVQRLWPDHAHKVRVLGVPDLYDPEERDLRTVLESKVRALLDELCGDRA